MPPHLVLGRSHTCKAVFSNTGSKLPGSIPHATSITDAAALLTVNPPPPPSKGGMLPPSGEPLPSEKRGSAFLGRA